MSKRFVEKDGVWQELLTGQMKAENVPSGNEMVNHRMDLMTRRDNGSGDHSFTERESPTTTVTTETGKQLLYRMKSQSYCSNQASWTTGSGRNGTSEPTKFSMKQTTIFPARVKRRVVFKNGFINLNKERIEKRHQRYLQDTFTTMVDIQWRWNLLVFALGFILSWLGFAVVWWVICLAHGDFEPHDGNWTPCVVEVTSFASAFLFSIETQHTIGYGGRATTEECPEAIFVMCMQSITGVMIQCFVVGFVFAKLSRPQKRSQTLLFSSSAVVCLRDGKLCLMFRLGDVRNRSHIIGASASAVLISKRVTKEGEVIPYYQTELDIKFDTSSEHFFFIWPATLVHVIDEKSPFYNMSSDTMSKEKFEIVVILEGTVESTGQSVQARSSYLPSEIYWGRRFEQLVGYKKDTGEFRVDYSKFNGTYEVPTPTSSAKQLEELKSVSSGKNSIASSVHSGNGHTNHHVPTHHVPNHNVPTHHVPMEFPRSGTEKVESGHTNNNPIVPNKMIEGIKLNGSENGRKSSQSSESRRSSSH